MCIYTPRERSLWLGWKHAYINAYIYMQIKPCVHAHIHVQTELLRPARITTRQTADSEVTIRT
jgi:hypothetical protein